MRLHFWQRLLLVVYCVTMPLLLVLVCSTPARAAARDPITVTARTQTAHFPNAMDFSITATDSSGPIVQARIAISKTMNSPLVSFDDAAKQTLGEAQVEQQWRKQLPIARNQPPESNTTHLADTTSQLVTGSIWFGLAALMGIVLVMVTMSARKHRLKRGEGESLRPFAAQEDGAEPGHEAGHDEG